MKGLEADTCFQNQGCVGGFVWVDSMHDHPAFLLIVLKKPNGKVPAKTRIDVHRHAVIEGYIAEIEQGCRCATFLYVSKKAVFIAGGLFCGFRCHCKYQFAAVC